MARYAVSYANFFDNDMTTVIVQAGNVFEAIAQHPKLQSGDSKHWLQEMRLYDLEAIKQEFFDADSLIDCVEVPDAKED